jgi:hypothetical protein
VGEAGAEKRLAVGGGAFGAGVSLNAQQADVGITVLHRFEGSVDAVGGRRPARVVSVCGR